MPFCFSEQYTRLSSWPLQKADSLRICCYRDSAIPWAAKAGAHMWYLYELAGLYLAAPLLRILIKNASRKVLEYGLILGFIFSSLIPFGEQLTGFNLNFTYPFSGIYLLYFVSGYYLLKYIKITPRLSAAAAVVTAGFLIVDMGFLKIFRVSYDSPFIVLLSACLFLTRFRQRRPRILDVGAPESMLRHLSGASGISEFLL